MRTASGAVLKGRGARRLVGLAADAARCTDCELYRDATQTVFGSGSANAPLALVGECPGDVEDHRGEPFVGPAGRVLWEGLESAGIRSDGVYVTNAVKHFRWEPRGKRRIHRTPGTEHIHACRHWLEDELRVIDPDLVVLLGAVAARSWAPSLRVTRDRGQVMDLPSGPALVTVHPAAVLRDNDRHGAMALFVQDLVVARRWIDANARR